MKILNNITSLRNKTIIPALLLAGGITAINHLNQNTISSKQNIEYMANNPASLAMETGLLAYLGKEEEKPN